MVKLDNFLKEREVESKLVAQRKEIIIEIDKLWHIYDRDRSG